jgi:hypothetical protein
VCGHVAGDGRVDSSDVAAYRAFLADPVGAPVGASASTRCAVYGDLAPYDLVQVVVIRRGLALPALQIEVRRMMLGLRGRFRIRLARHAHGWGGWSGRMASRSSGSGG